MKSDDLLESEIESHQSNLRSQNKQMPLKAEDGVKCVCLEFILFYKMISVRLGWIVSNFLAYITQNQV